MHVVKRIALLILVVCAIAPSPAQAAETGQIVGSVIDAKTKAPVAGASITAVSPSDRYHTKTDTKGNYTFSDVTADTYAISVEAQGYFAQTVQGSTVVPGQSLRIDFTLSVGRTLVTTHSRPITSPFQPNQPIDAYNLGSDQIATFVGKDFTTSGQQLLQSLPSVTVDREGTPLIRGGFGFELGYDVEGIDYREPAQSLTNRFQNFGNSDAINGVGNVEVIPGGGDATHGDTGTGLISITIKRGTEKPYTNVDLEDDGRVGGFYQFGIEDSRWLNKTGTLSNYFSFVASHTLLEYGADGTALGSIGASPITADPNATSNLNAATGSLYTTAYFNARDQWLRDFIDNAIVKFGRGKQQSLQFFVEDQEFSERLNAGGLDGLRFASPFPPGVNVGVNASGSAYGPIGNIYAAPQVQNAIAQIYPAFPYGKAGQPLNVYDSIDSPFTALKVDYRSPVGATGSFESRFYHTDNSQSDYLAEEGVYSPQNGGSRTGIQSDLSKSLGGSKHFLQFGGKFEFVHPYGTQYDTFDYSPAISGLGTNAGTLSIGASSTADLIPDFVDPSPTQFNATGQAIAGTPGCIGNRLTPTLTTTAGTPFSYNCGYLSRFFPNGIPNIPAEAEIPTANQQTYAAYLQDTYSAGTRFKALLGLRLDGYNFLLPDDPDNPPALDGLRKQRLYEPHVGLTYRLGTHDALRANFGSTLAIPLPTFLGLDIDKNAYSAFANIPSYDNSKGPFDPSRPLATQADYCGPGAPQSTPLGGVIVQGTQPCANYADQLYWLYRNYRFGLQSLFKFPLRGSTFTNYDFSYSHEFGDGTAVRITPFLRHGYDIVETSRTLLGFEPESEVAELSPEIYSNQGIQNASGIEFYLAKALGRVGNVSSPGLSYQVSATYVNQIGNDPPGTYLPTPSIELGELYPSPALSRFQSTFGITYRTRGGLRINPIVTLKSGYPYGAGVAQALFYGNLNTPLYVPLTNAVANGLVPNFCNEYINPVCLPLNGSLPGNGAVDPQNPGSITNPNIIASRGTESLTSGAGSLRSPWNANLDLFMELRPIGSRLTYGIGIENIFDQLADVPVANYAQYLIPISGGAYYNTGHTTSSPPTHSTPSSVGPNYLPYIVYPNQTPLSLRAYVLVHL